MSSSKSTSRSSSPNPSVIGRNNTKNNNNIKNDKRKPSPTTVVVSKLPPPPPLTEAINQILDKDEVPSCSKSLPPPNQHHVRFYWNKDENAQDGDRNQCNQPNSVATNKLNKNARISPRNPSSSGEGPPPLTPPLPDNHPQSGNDPENDPQSSDVTGNGNNGSDVKNNGEYHRGLGSLTHGFSDSVLAYPNLSAYAKGTVATEHDKEKELEERCAKISRTSPRTNIIQFTDLNNNLEEEKKYSWDNKDKIAYDVKKVDDNNNDVILWPSASEKLLKHATFLFQKSRRDELNRLANLLPRGREYVVFNVFTDFARIFYRQKTRRRHVMFPEEFLEKYEQQGDVAGKGRVVPATKEPFKELQISSKKRRLSAVYSSWIVKATEFQPKVERVDDVGKCESCLEKYLLACDCLKDSSNKKKQDITTVLDGFLVDLNTASLFILGHASRTYETSMSNLEFVKFHSSASTQITWSTNYAKQRLGLLSGSMWIFTYSIRTIITQAREKDAGLKLASIPSENNFRRILELFAATCVSLSENDKTVLQHSHNFYNFCKECIRIIKVIQVIVGFPGELRLKPPLKRGDGLELDRYLKAKKIIRKKSVTVKVAKSKSASTTEVVENPETLEWKTFSDMSGTEKGSCLRSLMRITTENMNVVRTQIRFLMDDIVESVKDVNEADLLYLLADMYDRVKFLQSVGMKRCKEEFHHISTTMTDFCHDFQSFIDYGQHIMKRFIEFRDMVHLSYEFMVYGLKLDSLTEMVPSWAFGYKYKKQVGCCGSSRGGDSKKNGMKLRLGFKRKVISTHHPKYNVLDFFRVYYEDVVKCNGEIQTNMFTFQIDSNDQPITAVIPVGFDTTWGEVEINSPRDSTDEYMERDDDEDEDDTVDKEKADSMTIKSIIVQHIPSNTQIPSGDDEFQQGSIENPVRPGTSEVSFAPVGSSTGV